MTLKEFISKYSLEKTLTFFTSNDLYYLDISIMFDIKHEYHIVDEDIYWKCLAICSAKSSLHNEARSICYRHINEYYSYIPQNSASCEKYNGYNGWSDDQIDDIFGGIPEATWNVD